MALRIAHCALLWGAALLVASLLTSAAELTRNVSRQTWDTESGLPQNTVQGILQTRDGYLWFATEGGLARFDSESFTIFNTRNTPQLRSNDMRALLEDSTGTLWIATADGVSAFKNESLRSFSMAEGVPSNSITGLFADSKQRPCIVTSAGDACFDQHHFVPALDTVGRQRAIDPNLQQYVSSPVISSYKDREGNTWIGTESTGVTILRNLAFQSLSDRRDGLDDQVRSIYKDRSGAIWLGTNSQGLIRYSNNAFTRFTVANGLSSNVIVSLGEDAAGNLLIGTPDGLNRLHDQAFGLITSSEGLPDDFIRSIYTDPDGTVWIGTRRGLARLKHDRFQTFTHSDGLGSDLVGSLTRDGSGYLWAATFNGLSRFDGAGFKNFTTADGLSSNVITALYSDHTGLVWIGTQGGGLNRFFGGSIRPVIFPGAPAVIYGITQDDRKHLWLASDAGVVRCDLSNENGEISEAVTYNVSDGLRVNECSGGGHPGIVKTPEGDIWFATLKGAALLRSSVVLDKVPAPVVNQSITIDNRTFRPTSNLEIAPGSSRLSFSYAALSFAAPQKVQYRYKLHGFDKNWIDAGNARTAFYTNLGPGAYSFQVIARNGDGVWNREGASFAFRLEPHFYQTWWFAMLMLLPLTAGIYGVYRWRVAYVEAQVESRFEAVLKERNRIAREIHDTLAQGFAGISVHLEMVSRKLGSSSDLARQHLDQARMLVRSSLAEARRSIWELRSQSDETENLASRLSKMAAQMGSSGQPKIAVNVRGAFRPLESRTEDELLRIAQEAVTNAIRHAEASQIIIELAFDSKRLHMTIADNGRGFSPTGQTTGVNGHFGLKGMYERAAGIDAKLNLDTAPGVGTKLSVEVPV